MSARQFRLFAFLVVAMYSIAAKAPQPECPAANTPIEHYKAPKQDSSIVLRSNLRLLDPLPNITLFDTACQPFALPELLDEGLPVLFVSVSYTCPQARESIQTTVSKLARLYANRLKIVLVYVLEAHPSFPDKSPFHDSVWVTSENKNKNILFRQHQTYADRRKMAALFIQNYHLNVKVLLDNPDNRFFKTFGPLPNNAVLVTKNKRVFGLYKHLGESFGAIQLDLPLAESYTEQPLNCTECSIVTQTNRQPVLVLSPGTSMIQILNRDGRLLCSFYEQTETKKEIPLGDRVKDKPGEYTLRLLQQNTVCFISRFTIP